MHTQKENTGAVTPAINVNTKHADISTSHNLATRSPLSAASLSVIKKSNLPTCMTSSDCRQWLLWKSVFQEGKDKKPRKVACYATGSYRGKTDTLEDRAQLVSFDEAYKTYLQGNGYFAGLGFALGADGRAGYWQGVDFDNIYENLHLLPLFTLLSGYIEASPSNTGIHCIGYGMDFSTLGSNKSGIEAYSRGRFFTVTGDTISGELLTGYKSSADVVDLVEFVNQQLVPIHKQYNKRSQQKAHTVVTNDSSLLTLTVSSQIEQDLIDALNCIPSDDRSIWIEVGLALRTLNRGFEIWKAWSKTSDSYEEDCCEERWETFTNSVSDYRHIFKLAKNEYGWNGCRPPKIDAATVGFGNATLPVELPPRPVGVDISESLADWQIVCIADTVTNPPKAPRFVVENWLPENDLTLVAGHGAVGKTQLMLQAAICIAMELPFLGCRTIQKRVIFFSGEDLAEVIRYRVDIACRQMGLNPQDVAKNIMVIDASSFPGLYEEKNKIANITAGYEKLRDYIKNFNAEVIIIDNASDTFDANENVRSFVRGFLRKLKQLKITVLLLAHVNKQTGGGREGSENYSGSSAWHNSSRSRWFLGDRGGTLMLSHEKSNYGRLAIPITLERTIEGVLVSKLANPFQDQAQDEASLRLLLAFVDKLYKRQDFLSPAKNMKDRVFKMLKGDPFFPKSIKTSDKMQTLLEGAESRGELMRESYKNNYKPSNRWKLTDKGLEAIKMVALSTAAALGIASTG